VLQSLPASLTKPPQAAAQGPSERPAARLREASFDDYPQVAALQTQRGMRFRSCEEWRNLWVGNPVYEDRHGSWPIGWVLEADHNIVGYLGNIPANYEFRGRRLTAGCGYSWVVAPPYRSYSVLLMDQYMRQEGADLCVSTTANPISYKAHVAFGARPVPVGVWDRSSVWITSGRGFVGSWLRRKDWPMPGLLSYPISTAIFFCNAASARKIGKRSKGSRDLEIDCCSNFDERFESFWQILRAENSDILLADRSRRALAWHFQYPIRESRLWIVTAKAGRCLYAYGLFMLEPNPADGLKRMVFVDFQAIRGESALFYSILQWALQRCRAAGVHLLLTEGLCPKGVEDVAALAPFHLQQPSWSYLYKILDPSLMEALSDAKAWAPSLFDGDATV
jgi:hypothetical protein